MSRTLKQSVFGRKISKAEALRGLGDPKTWRKESEALDQEFRARRVEITPKIIKLNTFGFSPRVLKALSKVGINPSHARNLPDLALRKVAGIGEASLKEIRRKLGRSSGKKKKRK